MRELKTNRSIVVCSVKNLTRDKIESFAYLLEKIKGCVDQSDSPIKIGGNYEVRVSRLEKVYEIFEKENKGEETLTLIPCIESETEKESEFIIKYKTEDDIKSFFESMLTNNKDRIDADIVIEFEIKTVN